MAEVDHPHDAEDDGQPQGGEGVETARRQTLQRVLDECTHRLPLMTSRSSGSVESVAHMEQPDSASGLKASAAGMVATIFS
ncbi:hypothetical protein KLO01_27530 [Knoellia locipacati]|uniref:Uncharacterized protein n=1 Tax=Knoellia locipacati TaxID=882824 RepID=A0A512T3B3_9MICO|nr:hypothetical protein KLO01_27530 [Knoellia locipacati]